jgi:hypothetical protein
MVTNFAYDTIFYFILFHFILFLQAYMGSTRVGRLSEMVEPVLGGYQKWLNPC